VYNGSLIWNGLIGHVLDKCIPYPNNVMVLGSSTNSDLSASISVKKIGLGNICFRFKKSRLQVDPTNGCPIICAHLAFHKISSVFFQQNIAISCHSHTPIPHTNGNLNDKYIPII
jgi:hypothetical protein